MMDTADSISVLKELGVIVEDSFSSSEVDECPALVEAVSWLPIEELRPIKG